MNILCLQANDKKELIEDEINRVSENYVSQEVFYPLWLLEVEVKMNFFASNIKQGKMTVGVDGLCGDVSFVCDGVQTCNLDVDPKQILPLTTQMDELGSAKVKDSLLPFILPKTRSIFVKPSVKILNYKKIYKHFYRLSRKDNDQVIFLDKSDGKIAVFNGGAS